MDEFLGRLGIQAVNYAMRCGIALTSTFALQQCSRLLKTVDNKPQRSELQALQRVLDSKIKIVSPALDLIEFKSGRGNVFLGNAAALAKTLHRDIVALGKRLEKAAETEELAHAQYGHQLYSGDQRQAEVVGIIRDIKSLLARIDSDIPLLQLAITASGESLSTALPPSISPSRLLQASMFLVVGDTQFSGDPCRPVQIGPSFTLSLYMLFLGHTSTGKAPSHATKGSKQNEEPQDDNMDNSYGVGSGERKPIWQEVLHKARVRICRTPLGWELHHGQGFAPHESDVDSIASSRTLPPNHQEQGEYAYHLEIIEDLDDGRAHEQDDTCDTAYDGIRHAGVQESIPIHQISKLFYTDSGRILNIGRANDFENNSVLLLKRDTSATVPTKTMAHMTPDAEAEEEEGDSSELSDEQGYVDHQLLEESRKRENHSKKEQAGGNDQGRGRWRFPSHLDPEWLALEVFAEEDYDNDPGDGDGDEGSDGDSDSDSGGYGGTLAGPKRSQRASLDTHLEEQMRNISISNSAALGQQQTVNGDSSKIDDKPVPDRLQPRIVQSPYGSVISSLSLFEMLVRLTSLQQFQQMSHLAIPDHILTFFLEETSATGLRGEARWQAKRAAEQRMGFDPFTDTPIKGRSNEML